MTNSVFDSISDFRDIESLNYYAAMTAGDPDGSPSGDAPDDSQLLAALRRMSRDNARTPMQWTSGPHAGFSSAEPWIGVNPNHRQINAERELADPDSVFHHYRKLIALRHTHPIVARGSFEMLLPEDEQVYAFTRRLDSELWLVLGNFTGADVQARLPEARDWAAAELLIGNYPATAKPAGPHSAPAFLPLRPWECRVYRRTTAPG
ncbi:MAG TPA: alpha-glucosidase C-terminal domain-containing protein [Jatrophihabitans sp.]